MADDRLIVALDVSTMDAGKKSYYPSVIRLAFTRSAWSYSTPKEQKQFVFTGAKQTSIS